MKFVRFLLILGAIGIGLGFAALAGIYLYLEPQLPDTRILGDIRLQTPLRIYSADNKLIAEFGEKRRIPLAYEETPKQMVQAFLAAEDANFFTHPGVDYRGLLRAGIQLILTGKRRQGGSTITMQVARNYFLSREKTFIRKFNEIFLALRIEQELSKEKIMELYLNKIYLGQRAYGIGAAAQVYYGKAVDELTLTQIAMIAGLPKAPSAFNPIANPSRAITRRNYVLRRMQELGLISRADYEPASQQPVTARIHSPDLELQAPYIAEMVRAEMLDRFGEEAYTSGYSVYTSVNSALQDTAAISMRKAMESYDRRHGWRGAEGHGSIMGLPSELDHQLAKYPNLGGLTAGIVTEIQDKTASLYLRDKRKVVLHLEDSLWARKYISEDKKGPKPKAIKDILQPGDIVRAQPFVDKDGQDKWRLAQIPKVSGAFVALDPNDGHILSLVGGYDFSHSKFNRAIQAKRQPGSGFKAFIYSAALEAGFTPASLINDAPVVFNDTSLEGAWRPENYSGKFFGPTRLRYALTKSRNLVSIRLLRAMGIKHTLAHAARFGFDTNQLPHNLSLALGSAAVTPLQMARGYSVLANDGYLIEPHLIRRIEEAGRGVVFEHKPVTVCKDCPDPIDEANQDNNLDKLPHAPRVISKQNRFLMYNMMQDVITGGTATRARVLARKDLAGKTGTTNDQRDAWFNGYNQGIVAIAWVGFDSSAKLGRGEVGGRAALPAWIDFMRVALEDIPDIPPQAPEGIVTVRIDPKSGLLAPAGMKGSIFEVFRSENVPETLSLTTTKPGGAGTPDLAPGVEDLF